MLLGILYSLYSSARQRNTTQQTFERRELQFVINFVFWINKYLWCPEFTSSGGLVGLSFSRIVRRANRIKPNQTESGKRKWLGSTALKTHDQPFNKADGASGAGSGGNPCRFLLLHHLKNVSGWPANCLCSTNVFGFSLSLSIYRGKKGA